MEGRMKIIAKNGELELYAVSDDRGYVYNTTSKEKYPEMSIGAILSRGNWEMVEDKPKKIVVLKKQRDDNIDKALFRDVGSPADKAWGDAIWADMVARYSPVQKEMKIVSPTSDDEDWMHNLPGYEDEESL